MTEKLEQRKLLRMLERCSWVGGPCILVAVPVPGFPNLLARASIITTTAAASNCLQHPLNIALHGKERPKVALYGAVLLCSFFLSLDFSLRVFFVVFFFGRAAGPEPCRMNNSPISALSVCSRTGRLRSPPLQAGLRQRVPILGAPESRSRNENSRTPQDHEVSELVFLFHLLHLLLL